MTQRTTTQRADRKATDRLAALAATVEGLTAAVALGHAGLVRQWALRLDMEAIDAYKACMSAAEQHEGDDLDAARQEARRGA